MSKVTLTFAIPAVDYVGLWGGFELFCTFFLLFMMGSISSLVFLKKHGGSREEAAPIFVVLCFWASPAFIGGAYVLDVLGGTWIGHDELEDLRGKAEALDELYGVDEE